MFNIFNKLRQLLGVHCLEYALNQTNLEAIQSADGIVFNANEIAVLELLNQKIKEIRVALIQQDAYEDQYLTLLSKMESGGKPIFHLCRSLCGGEPPLRTSETDELLNYCFQIASREYPTLLMKQSGLVAKQYNYNQKYPMDFEGFEALIGRDKISDLLNREAGLMSAIKFVTDDDISHCTQTFQLLENIITISFQNCTFRGGFTYEDLTREIAKQVLFLRQIVNNEEAEYSSFIGIVGLNLGELGELRLEDLVVRQFDDRNSPNKIAQMAMHNRSQNGEVTSFGCIGEINHRTRLIGDVKDYSGPNSRKTNEYVNKIENAFSLALIFTTFEPKGFKYVFSTMGLCTSSAGNFSYTSDNKPHGMLSIEKGHLDRLDMWYQLLKNTDLKTVELPLRKLSQAVFERKNSTDSFIDAITALEGMFGAQGETLFKVSTSVSRFLYDSFEERTKSKRSINTLYKLRSQLVHGANDSVPSHEVIEESTNQILELCFHAISKLLQDEKLLALQPHERINLIVYGEDY
ncbi:HEPN domain-containing protein [Vibrio splendidus]|uniref:HEPN domain-containing protein n=1 Tax=Vibrio splendidus TaxID=29497 RepID=UPI002468ED1D|nr:HEPN domain-containing protein [Vibrio splendidus]MDH5933247.1 HEPN domain-containing protein [Vibrio splendidus]